MALENIYRPRMNAHAYKRLAVRQSIPNINLNIGENEDLRSKPVLVFMDAHANMLKVGLADNRKRPIENVGVAGDGYTISENDLIAGDMFLGSAVEVI